MTKIIFSGIQPTNHLTIGNYLGAIKNWLPLQQNNECIFCVVDLHSITVNQNLTELYNSTISLVATYLACGIKLDKAIIFIQSHVAAHTELAWILSCIAPLSWLSRMTQFKEKVKNKQQQECLGLFSYPILMAADILLYNTDIVPVGEDQKQHIEITRDIAQAFNNQYSADIFKLPEPLIMANAARIMSLKNVSNKMSKSDIVKNASILLTDTPDEISVKIRKATTDSQLLPENVQDLQNRLEAKNLLTIFAAFSDQSIQDVVHLFAGKEFLYLKNQLADLIVANLVPIQEKYNLYMQDKAQLNDIVLQGAQKARNIANNNLDKIKHKIGLYSCV